jgi:uracil-DNA glycosylase family 4
MSPWSNTVQTVEPPEQAGETTKALQTIGYDMMEVYPLTSPGMPIPGPDFVAQAVGMGDEYPVIEGTKLDKCVVACGPNLEELYKQALYTVGFVLPVKVKGRQVNTTFIPGHLWGSDMAGPRPARVMLVGKWPGPQEVIANRNLVGESGAILIEALESFGISWEEWNSWYITNLVKHPNVDPASQKPAQSIVRNCLPLLSNELRFVRPDFVLAMGAEAYTALVGKGEGSVSQAQGRIFERSCFILDPDGDGTEGTYHSYKVMGCIHPAAVAHSADSLPAFRTGIEHFVNMVRGQVKETQQEELHHQLIYNEAHLASVVDTILDEDPAPCVAIDCEWHGEYPTEPGAWLRTVQFSHKPGHAYCLVLREAGGRLAFRSSIKSTVPHLRRLLLEGRGPKKPRLIGHSIRADLPWLTLGLDRELGKQLIEASNAPENVISPDGKVVEMGWRRTKEEGGFDTMLAAHSIRETDGSYSLDILGLQYCGIPRYDQALQKWKAEYCKTNHMELKELDGYGMCPDDILHPYACLDADVTQQLFPKFNGELLDHDPYDNDSRIPFWISMRASLGFLEMEMTGLLIDRPRGENLTQVYLDARNRLRQKLEELFQWPGFNPNSAQQCKVALFGEKFSDKRDPDTGELVKIQPPGALLLNLLPIKTAGKPSKDWELVIRKKQEHLFGPSTDKEVLGGLITRLSPDTKRGEGPKFGFEHVTALRNFRFAGQVVKSVLRAPVAENTQHNTNINEDGQLEYEEGVLSCIHVDGRVRTHLFQTKETGRASSARPPLQNWSKRREKAYKDILGESYLYPLRTMAMATPGWVFVEADYRGAELFMMAIQSGDQKMIEHCLRANLPDSDPNQYDIHSNLAVRAFGLKVTDTVPNDKKKNPDKLTASQLLKLPVGSPLPPTKTALWAIGMPHIRDVTKCVAAGSRLLTDRGWIRVEELCGALGAGGSAVGDGSVISDNGVTPLVGLYNGGVKPCIKLTGEDGYELISSETHKYRVVDKRGRYVWRAAADMKPGDWVAVLDAMEPKWTGDATFPAIEVEAKTCFKDMDFPEQFNEDWAAFLGLYISEGSANPVTGVLQICLAVEDDPTFGLESVAVLSRLFGGRLKIGWVDYEKHQNQIRLTLSTVKLARWLDKYCPGDSYTKRVPDFVFKWPPELQRVFLRWLYEGDGSVKKNGKGFSITYATASEGLAKDVQILLNGHGVYVRRSSERRKGYDHNYWCLQLKYNESRCRFVEKIGFVTASKQNKCANSATYALDWDTIPYQDEHLRIVFQYLTGAVKEKCRECVRKNQRVRLTRNRLLMLVEQLMQHQDLPRRAQETLDHLQKLSEKPVRFERVKTIESVGVLPVYDVQTTEPHSVCYNGYLTHQTIVFGLPYGRGDKAIIRAVEEEGTQISMQDAAAIRAAILTEYADLGPYLERCQARVKNPGWMRNCYGRYRRFQRVRFGNEDGSAEREAGNFPIQSGVADAVSRALDHLYTWPDRYDENGVPKFRMVLQIHDAILFEVQIPWLEWFIGTEEEPGVVGKCMTERVAVWMCDLNGDKNLKVEPFHMGIETGVYHHWGEGYGYEDGLAAGVPAAYLPKPKKAA